MVVVVVLVLVQTRQFSEEQLRKARADASVTKLSQGSHGVRDVVAA
jgi:hypothetical protein